METGQQQGQEQSTPAVSSERDPVKEVEVTAKQIVDRITSNRNSSAEKVIKGPVKRISLSSAYGDQALTGTASTTTVDPGNSKVNGFQNSQQQQQQSSGQAEGDRVAVVNQSPGRSERVSVNSEPSEHEKKAEILLNGVTKWLNEVGSDGDKSPRTIDIGEAEDNFHWIFSIESYIRSLTWSSQKVLTSKFMTVVVKWHKQLFHFNKEKVKDDDVEYNRVLPHWDINGGLVPLAKLNLLTAFPSFPTKGYHAFLEDGKTPVIYCSDELVGQLLATKLGLPQSFINVLNTQDDDWVENFEKTILDHDKNNVVPLLLILNADAKNLHKGSRLAEAYNIWVHLYGANLLPYLILRTEHNQIGTSFTLDYSKWIQTPALPYLTFYKSSGKAEASSLELSGLSPSTSDVAIFGPWFILNVYGHDEIVTMVTEASTRGKFLYQMIRKYKCLHLLPTWSELNDGNVIITSLTFQYQTASEGPDDDLRPSTQYVDTLNSWLYHIMDRDLKDFIPVEFVHSPSGDWNIHIDVTRCPKLEPEDENVVISLFDNHLSVLQSTVAQKIVFSKLVQEAEELAWIDHEAQWAGLGAVRYVPSFHRKKVPVTDNDGERNDSSSSKSDSFASDDDASVKENIDHLNAQIVDKLKAIDSAFSLGESSNGEWCVQFGMVTMETDVKELVRLVVSSGQEIEESSEFLSRMSELVKKGIEKATEELRRESEEALWEEGIFRRVPIVGTFVSWFSPPAKETGVRGRALNLTQGKVELTENIYKYHMQVECPPSSHSSSNNN